MGAYIPKIPFPRQETALALDVDEALYGGAAGGGKTDFGLMWILEGVVHPGYAGIIFRRNCPQLKKAGDGLIPRSMAWLKNTDAKWNGNDMKWTWPNGSTVEFGHLHHQNDVFNYAGPSYHRILFEELTQFFEDMYTFLFSRLRRDVGFPLKPAMRATANPGGIGHEWVRKRFITDEAREYMMLPHSQHDGRVFYSRGEGDEGEQLTRAFLPSLNTDNQYLDQQDYAKKLSPLPPVMRERLLRGDWSILEDSIFRPDWLRDWTKRGEYIQFHDINGNVLNYVDQRSCRRFATIDCASTSAEKARESRGKPPSWSVIGIWDRAPGTCGPYLALRHVWRGRVGFTDLCSAVRKVCAEYKPSKVHVENEKTGQALIDTLSRGDRINGHPPLPMVAISHGGKDKLTRSNQLQNRFERGEVFLPRDNNSWRQVYEAELLTWQGHDDETSDQIDMSAYAAMVDGPSTNRTWGGVITV